jgi:hypothetical protein
MPAPLDKRKLIMVLGMLGSAHDGEIAAAGRQAAAMLRAAQLTWHDVIRAAAPFDKTIYQRNYMRQRRAQKKAARTHS